MEQARLAAARSVNTILTATYWEIGRRIVGFEQKGARRAEYGKRLLERLAQDLTYRFGRGFGYSNLNLIRQFYLTYQCRHLILQSPIGELSKGIPQTASAIFPLSWTHYVRLIGLDDEPKRGFYEDEARRAGWSVRQLDRLINSMLYERVALSKKRENCLKKRRALEIS